MTPRTGEVISQGRTAKRRLLVQNPTRTGSQQLQLFGQEEWDDLPLVNALRADVERWRETNYRNATPVTRELLQTLGTRRPFTTTLFLPTRSR